ncbi:Hsp70 family protein [Rhodomicrobium sp. Az07]|uniref:Hsp70 family protein n=1 Tax=Rhodomicrobium sp. Az07 TaxID=2839034 RepID=UPI001BE6AE97|nr:Hsp70 family protein [Rhodomicrobium sp. Az07]MBT3072014.1 Hsp70 family protein [Rhodomicrobium sp. Az07]
MKEIDPTGFFSARTLLRLFIAYLLHRAAEQAHAECLPWPIPLRVARPAWEPKRARDGEILLRDLVEHGFAIADIVGSAISDSGGLDLNSALAALEQANENVRQAKKNKTISSNMFVVGRYNRISVPEATAVAANTNRRPGRRLVVVADIGGGTSDFGAFMTPVQGQKTMAEVNGGSHILTRAGDFLDMQLIRFILSEAGYLEGHQTSRGITRRLTNQGRQNKEILFAERTLKLEIDDRLLNISLDKFLSRPEVQNFAEILRERFRQSLLKAKQCAQAYRSANGLEPPIEIMLTGGGNSLPMVRALLADPGLPGNYVARAPEIIEDEDTFEFDTIRPQLAVAIGGALKDLPSTTNLIVDRNIDAVAVNQPTPL